MSHVPTESESTADKVAETVEVDGPAEALDLTSPDEASVAEAWGDSALPNWWVRAAQTGPSWIATIAVVVAALFVGAGAWVGIRAFADRPNASDIGFSDDMTAHHFQALSMSWRYIERGTDPVLLSTAKEIVYGQSGEIQRMQEMISGWNAEVSDDIAMEWMGMSVPQDQQPGMASDADMERLSKLSGRELDDLWSSLMIKHHGGGVHMARAALDSANNSVIRSIADRTVRVQQMEINEMNQWRVANGHPVVKPDVD